MFLLGFTGCHIACVADEWPSRPVRMVVPYSPGGSGDIVARELAQRLTQTLGRSVYVENRAGASGNVGTDHVAKSAADGYTLLLASDIQFAISPHFSTRLTYAVGDFAPVSLVATVELVLTANPVLGVDNVPELVALAKSRPGKINYASTGPGSTHQLAMELLQQRGGFKLTHVPYRGSGQALPDLLSGQMQLMLLGVPQTLPYLRDATLNALAVGAVRRLVSLPDVPTISESYPGFEANNYWCLFVPAGTPNEIITKLARETARIVAIPDLRDRFQATGLEPIGGTPAMLAARLEKDSAKWAQVISDLGIKEE
jgi:tripartite-type tricarboxylate transporter receptor subunit TctC